MAGRDQPTRYTFADGQCSPFPFTFGSARRHYPTWNSFLKTRLSGSLAPATSLLTSTMRFSLQSQLLSLILPILLSIKPSLARPRISDQFRELLESRYHYLSERSCANPCGWAAQGSSPPLCCGSDQSCGTNSLGQAVCDGGGSTQASVQDGQSPDEAGSGSWTTTVVEQGPVTRTVTYSNAFGSIGGTAAAAAQIGDTSCQTDMGEKPCGTICCATGQYCLYAGQCAASQGDGDSESSSILGQIFTPAATNTAPLRPTSNAATTVTSTGSATTTVAFSTPSSAAATATAAGGAAGVSESSNNGLSGGAIAGIVIGVLAAIIILILLLIFCCAATATDAILGFFGLRNRKRRREDVTYVEEHRHHHGSGTGRRRWFGMGPVRVEKKKKKSNVGGLTAVAGGLTTLAVILGLKRRRDKKAEKSEYGSSSYYSDYYSYSSKLLYRLPRPESANEKIGSDSSRSDDRYTRRSGRSVSRR